MDDITCVDSWTTVNTVECSADQTLELLGTICNGQARLQIGNNNFYLYKFKGQFRSHKFSILFTSCEMEAWTYNSMFGDPCKGTTKYTTVEYACVDPPVTGDGIFILGHEICYQT